jgi:asparagine synthase (glutamine-hydrolysing)
MCGIAGFSGTFSPDVLKIMGARIAHRGPDSSGEFYSREHQIGLVHTRLSIIDLSPAGYQPMLDASGQVAIVFNGEIYNFRELRTILEIEGCRFLGHSDTEVLLHLYLRHGEAMLSKLNGVFAFAIWDARNDSVFVARDPLGVKPLYYSESTTGVVFSSEMKALLVNPEVSREVDSYAVLMHLTYLWCPAPHTILAKVKKLPPGYAIQLSGGKIVRQWKYYELPYDQEILPMSVDEASQSVLQAIRTAVERQMVSDVPVGAFLSGGLDSSAVVAFAKQSILDVRLQCFTIGFEEAGKDGFADDLPYAKRVAEHLGVDLHIVHAGSEMAQQLEKMIYHLDEPLADPASLNALFICQLAREHGIKVLLSGAGGDDIFSGYRRHYALQQERYWSWLPAGARHLLAKGASLLPISNPTLRRVRKAFEYAGMDANERLVSYFYWAQPTRLFRLLSARCQADVGARQVTEPLLSAINNMPADTEALNRMLFLESKFFLPDHNLNYTDKMSMATGVEVRVPLLDLDLVSLAARLPVDFKQHGREGKWIFKKAMEEYLPHDVIYRPKTGFGAPLRSWLRSKQQLQPLLSELLSDTSIIKRGIFDPDSVKSLIIQDANGLVDAAYTIFSMMCIELWCRKFIDEDFY